MKVMVWTCDRCRVTVEVPRLLVEEDGSVVEHGCGPREWIFDLAGWEKFGDGETVTDVCPNCVTAGERADRVIREAESNVIFGPEGAA